MCKGGHSAEETSDNTRTAAVKSRPLRQKLETGMALLMTAFSLTADDWTTS